MIPLAYSLGAGTITAVPLDLRQREEFFFYGGAIAFRSCAAFVSAS